MKWKLIIIRGNDKVRKKTDDYAEHEYVRRRASLDLSVPAEEETDYSPHDKMRKKLDDYAEHEYDAFHGYYNISVPWGKVLGNDRAGT